jgi:hypothetical protein
MALLHKMATRDLFFWSCCEKCDDSNVVTFLYGGGVMEQAMAEGAFVFLYLFFNFLCGVFGLIR